MKVAYNVMSDSVCKCGQRLKQNLVEKKKSAKLCYKCWRLANGKPAHHQPRRKRIEAGLPVHK